MRNALRRAAAYTLIEVLVVVTILGILGGVVVPSLLTAGEMGVQAAARNVIADLMVAQNEAVAAQAQRSVYFDVPNDRYAVLDENGRAVRVAWLPTLNYELTAAGTEQRGPDFSGRNFITDLTTDPRFAGVRIESADFGGAPRVVFDDLGAPKDGGTVRIHFERRTYEIEVIAFTGRIAIREVN